jgi:hypothetical protein
MDRLAHQVATRWVQALAQKPYLASIRLDSSSQSALKNWWLATVGPALDKLYCDHVTLFYKPSEEQILSLPLGARVTFKVVGWAESDSVQAVKVRLPKSLDYPGRISHVTIATDGTPPVESNTLLRKGYEVVSGPTIHGIVQLQMR